jgi:hypothetical protein
LNAEPRPRFAHRIETVPKVFPNSPAHDPHATLQRDVLLPLRLWHLASLDAPSVAVCWTLSLARAARVRLPAWVPLLVALVVWAVYVADRLLDARADLALDRSHRLRERHYFHWQHRRLLAPLAALAAACAAWILWRLVPAPVRHRDSLLAAAALAYFTRVHAPSAFALWIRPSSSVTLSHPSRTKRGMDGAPGRRRLWAGSIGWWRERLLRRVLTKELLVGLLFTAGCLLPAWSRAQTPAAVLAAPAVALALLAWLNCALIDEWEGDNAGLPPKTDRALATRAANRAWASRPSRDKACAMDGAQCFHLRAKSIALAGFAFLAATLLVHSQQRSSLLIFAAALSALLLAALDHNRRRLAPVTLRAMADLVLLTPAVLLATGISR